MNKYGFLLKMIEAEDIMYDQCILASNRDFNVSLDCKKSTKLWLAVNLVTHSLLPSFVNFCYACIRNQQNVVYSVRHQIFPALAAFLANSFAKSLASVQKLPLKLNRVDEYTEKCVECVVLCEPSLDHVNDVIFVHGLHGGLEKTWKQGRWAHERHKLRHQAPVRRQSTGNMFVPVRPKSLKRALSDMYSRIPRKVAKRDRDAAELFSERGVEEEVGDDGAEYSRCWPRDWLPLDCPNSRVIALNYTTDVLWCPLWQKKRNRTDIIERSKEMSEELLKLGVGKKPIVWVGHSKGGLFIKQMIVNALEESESNAEQSELFGQTKGIMFYSVPHKGAMAANFSIPFFRRSIEVLEVQRNCDFVLDLHRRFVDIFKNGNNNVKPEVFSFIETAFTLMGFMYVKVIPYESAEADVGTKCDVPLDHREICKPADRNCFLYLELVKLINKCSSRE